MKIGTKITGMSVALLAVAVAAIMLVILSIENNLSSRLETELTKSAEKEVQIITDQIGLMLQVQHETLTEQLANSMETAWEVVDLRGGLREGLQQVPWRAVNQISKAGTDVTLPTMMVGDRWLGQNPDPAVTTPLVDTIGEITGATCTVFQRMNPSGDLLRVATNIKKLDGDRAIGTYIPSSSPVAQTIRDGQVFRGRAFVVNAWYLTTYAPIRGENGEIIGALYVGVRQENVESLRNGLQAITVGKTGYTFVLAGSGKDMGEILVHPKADMIGKNVIDMRDDDGEAMFREAIEGAKNSAGSTYISRYQWQQDGKQVTKLAGSYYFEPWDWVVFASADQNEFMATRDMVLDSLNNLSFWTVLISGIVLVAGLLVSWILGRSISRPILSASDFADKLGRGDVSATLETRKGAGDELMTMTDSLNTMAASQRRRAKLAQSIADGDLSVEVKLLSDKDQLGKAFQRMVENLNGLMADIHDAADQVSSSSAQVSDSSQELSQGATEQASSLEEITSSLTQISSQTKLNAENMNEASRLVEETRAEVKKGVGAGTAMAEAMTRIATSSEEVAKIIKVIDEIAFQTNLLALNAAVEAARAGRHGKGFAVVAEEVRSLAGRSAKAAQETSSLIEEAVERVHQGTTLVKEVEDGFEGIETAAGRVAGLVGDVATASSEQAEGVAQVNEGLSQVDQVTQQNTASAEETASAAEELSSMAAHLKGMLEHFRLRRRQTSAQSPQGDRPKVTVKNAPAPKPRKVQGGWQALDSGHDDPEDMISLDDDDFGKY